MPASPHPPPRPGLSSAVYGLIAAAAVALLVHGTGPYTRQDYASDDAFISLRYAQRLATGHGLSWNDGEWVEGYSNLLWVLAEAGLGALGMELFLAMRLLSFAGMGLGLLCLAWYLRPQRTGSILPGACAMLAWVSTQLHIIALCSGFETPFVVGLLSVTITIILPGLEAREGPGLRPFLLAGVPLGMLALTRPDGALFTAVFAAGLLVLGGSRPAGWRRAMAVTITPAACVGGQLAFRLWRYQDWIPNTARVKLPGGGLARALEGLDYVIDGLHHQRGLWLPALLVPAIFLPRLGAWPRLKRPTLMLLGLCAAWTVYVIWAGGVWLEGRRFLVPTVMLLCWLAGMGLAWLCAALRARDVGGPWYALLALLLAMGPAWLHIEQWRDPEVNREIHNQFHWKKKGTLLAELWGISFAQRGTPFIAVDTAGAIPYYTAWPTLDMLGLNDRWIATHPPPDPAWQLSGHTHGDGAYTIDRAPDLVFFGVHWGTWGGVFTGGQQMHADPRFYEQYRYIEMERLEP